jgi:hypothetical protein
MKTRTKVIAAGALWTIIAAGYESVAAVFVAIAWTSVTIHLHNVELKVNKLLDHYGLTPDLD